MGAQYTLPFTPATYTIEAQSNARHLNYVLGTTDVSEFFKVAYIDYTTPGSNTLTMPSRASYISVILIGGGGGGGGGTGSITNNRCGGGGGAGAALVSNAFSVASGITIAILVGAGGTGGATSANGGNGSVSSISIDDIVKFSVDGGDGGKKGVSGGAAGAGGLGGTIGASDADTNNTVVGSSGANGSGATGGNGGGRTTLNNASPAYCEDYIATGGTVSTSGSGSGYGAGSLGGTLTSGVAGKDGLVRIYFYI